MPPLASFLASKTALASVLILFTTCLYKRVRGLYNGLYRCIDILRGIVALFSNIIQDLFNPFLEINKITSSVLLASALSETNRMSMPGR
ncbi:hypothetical protein JavanS721_0005 [Streptococcus satellite phage Javan721]|nr:hypothetical protein JavanS721_0005 [Streptococcus satellite phage Javan721]